MNRFFPFVAAGLLLFCTEFSLGQKPTPTPDKDDVVRITTSLVQIDVLVTDKDGRQITDLKAEDFELLQDNKAQKITKFTYVSTPSSRSTAAQIITAGDPNAPAAASRSLGRIVTFIIDDGNCSSSQIGMMATREALDKFANEQMLPNDRVAIYQTRSGSSMMQQYTSDKVRLLQTIRKVRWYPPSGSCSSPDGSFFERARSNTMDKLTPDGGVTTRTIESEEDRRRREANEDFNTMNQTVGTVGVLNYVIGGLESVPGRKMVFFLSDGLPLRSRQGSANTALDVMRDVTDRANRNSVVFNTINVRGSFDPGFVDARDQVDVGGEIDSGRPSGTSEIVANRTRDSRMAEEGLFFVANETGGKYYRGSNFLDNAINKGLQLEQGYYLIGYEPDDETFKGKDFHKIEVKINRPSLQVSSRSGFLGKPDSETPSKLKTADSELYKAIAAPLPKAGLDLRLTAFFGNTPADGNFIRSYIALRGADITFTDESGGTKKAVFDVVVVTLDEKSKVADEFNKTHSIKVDPRTAEAIKANGLIYSVDVPVKKNGTYTLRVAIRDASSKLLGSAGQAILIPEIKKGGFVMSGLSISQLDADGKYARPSMTKPENGFSLNGSAGGPATRQFTRQVSAAYSYTIYAGTDRSALTVQVNLYKDGKLISEGAPKNVTTQSEKGRIDDLGFLRISEAVAPGEYTLEVIVKDPAKNQSASQTVDFEVLG